MTHTRFLRIYGFLGVFLLLCLSASAQQQLLYSQYMFNGLVINPAYAGSHEALSMTAMYRSQWAGLDGAPTSQAVSGHMPVTRKRIALGGTIYRESVDFTDQIGVQLAYAYKIPLRDGNLSLGLQGGFLNTRRDFSKIFLRHEQDPSFPLGVISAFMPSFGAGLYYSSDVFFLGASVPQLAVFNRGRGMNQVVDVQEIRQFIFNTGYIVDLNNDVKFKPGLLVRVTDGIPIEFDINTTLVINETFWFGLSYRHNTSLNFMTQLQVTKQLQVGYGYDLSTNKLRTVSSGSHEVMVNYRLRPLRGPDVPVVPTFF
jgi:type IX secretion system PorP/SprF family membrane protein